MNERTYTEQAHPGRTPQYLTDRENANDCTAAGCQGKYTAAGPCDTCGRPHPLAKQPASGGLFEGFRARPQYDEQRDDAGRLIARTIRRTPRPEALEPEDVCGDHDRPRPCLECQ